MSACSRPDCPVQWFFKNEDRWCCMDCFACGDIIKNNDGTTRYVRDEDPMFPDNPVAQ